MTENRRERILSILLKEPLARHTATSIANALKITRQGTWKTLNKLAGDKLISLESVGDSKTSTTLVKLNWDNPLTEKTLSLVLTKESLKQQRWRVNFEELGNAAKFLVLFGSVLSNPKEANDIDILAVVSGKNFGKVENITAKAQKTQIKKIHEIDITETELKDELRKPNIAYLDALKKGIILHGQDSFIQFMRGI